MSQAYYFEIRSKIFTKKTIKEIALVVYHELCHSQIPDNICVYSDTGRVLDVNNLFLWGKNQFHSPRPYPYGSYRFRLWDGEGPVPGTRKHRGGYHYYRRPGTQSTRRVSQDYIPRHELRFADQEEINYLEPAPRAARKSGNLPEAWDDYPRTYMKSWKFQHYGSKSWDRQGHKKSPQKRAFFFTESITWPKCFNYRIILDS